ncbi:MAG TPA: Ig-like domain-containing protein [Candidatus Sulfotelmatobacter sp.]|nr:Ig-like domain-containing protein [Candidatus Sulfotelmatobacter sp.]
MLFRAFCFFVLPVSRVFRLAPVVAFAAMALMSIGQAQMNVVTQHYDVARTGQNTSETLLTPGNVNKAGFGFRFSQPVDGYIVGQALYLSNVSIPNAGTHNVVYVATLHDSVYAFDADSNVGANAAPLWHVNFTNPAAGITTASGASLPCPDVTAYPESGIVSTPVIDPNTGTMYVVAKTNENGTVFHRLHALDVATGADKFAAPLPISGQVKTHLGTVATFNSLHAMNRPALLLNNGILYVAFGSNGCNDSAYGWVFAYNATSLAPMGVFNTAPEKGLGSIWQTGSGPAADSEGNIYVSTAEAHFTGNTGGQDFGSSILKLSEASGILNFDDYFTPFNQAIISADDLDLSACGVVVLPDQTTGPTPHLLVASGKQGTVYLLNRDNMGQYDSASGLQTDPQIEQELTKAVGAMFSTPVYWNNRVYFTGDAHPVTAYTLNNGLLTSPQQSITLPGGHSPVISANGNTNGIVWVIEGQQLYALDAMSLKVIYSSGQAGTRDTLPTQPHFSTEMVANGKAYVGTQTNLMVLGLLPTMQGANGNNQTATVATTLPVPLSVQLTDPYTGQPVSGVTVNFSDGAKGGTFGNSAPVTDSTGTATTTYTFGKTANTVTITAANPAVLGTKFTETAIPGPPKFLLLSSGGKQSAQVTTSLPAPVVVKVTDQFGNGISGMTVNFSDGSVGGGFSAKTLTTNSLGKASITYTTTTKAQAFKISSVVSGLPTILINETAIAGPPASMSVLGGNNQSVNSGTALPQALTVQLTDQFNNPTPAISVSYSDGGAGGSFSANPVSTTSAGQASTSYTPSFPGPITITATAGSLSSQFTETAQ